MKNILEYLYNRKGAIKSELFIKNFDIVEINEKLYIYLTDDAFKKIDPEFRDLIINSINISNKYTISQGIFYNNEGNYHSWMPRADYDDNGVFAEGNPDFNITKLWSNIDKINFNNYMQFTQIGLNNLIKSKSYKLIWKR